MRLRKTTDLGDTSHDVANYPKFSMSCGLLDFMTDRRSRITILIVGGGAAGTLAALHLVRESTDALDLVVVEPAERLGGGTAFSTPDPAHLLNVPAAGMSALPDAPGHFANWRSSTTGNPVDPYEFAPRREWGRYVAETLRTALAEAPPRVTLTHVRRTATAVDAHDDGITLVLDDGTILAGHAVVIGVGLPAPSDAWAPDALRTSDRFVSDPWAPGALERIRDTSSSRPDVLVVGTGLTMVDVVTTIASADRVLHAVSRSGQLPARHAVAHQAPAVPDVTDWGHDLELIETHVRAHLCAAQALTGDWRSGSDGLRHLTQDLWGRLSEPDRLRFLSERSGEWNRIRHRVPSTSAQHINQLRADEQLIVSAARVSGAHALSDGLRVHLTDGQTLDVGWVVNCTGPETDIRRLGDRLLDDLLRERSGGALALSATAGMGFRTRNGRVLDSSGTPGAPIWVLGSLRRGELWESTAVPEIRNQAFDTAGAVLDATEASPTLLTEGLPR